MDDLKMGKERGKEHSSICVVFVLFLFEEVREEVFVIYKVIICFFIFYFKYTRDVPPAFSRRSEGEQSGS